MATQEQILECFRGLTAPIILPPKDICIILKRIRQINLAIDRSQWKRAAKIANELDTQFNCGSVYFAYKGPNR